MEDDNSSPCMREVTLYMTVITSLFRNAMLANTGKAEGKRGITMSERILIRAWDRTHKTMRYNYCGKSGDLNNDWVIFFPEYDDRGNLLFGGINNQYPREQFILMLASSVTNDSNNKSIYEFDIVQDLRGKIFSVAFDGVEFYAHGDETDCQLRAGKWTIVGNTFEDR